VSGSLSLRRRWLFGAAAWGAMSMPRAASWAAPRLESAREDMQRKLISLLHAPERARQVGVVYLQSPLGRLLPPIALLETVLADIGPGVSAEVIRRYVIARIRRELQEVRVISLDGWIMSPTEAQLCALSVAGWTPQ
jgi:hypothetical protein